MDTITVTAKTLDEAITKAAIELRTSSDNLEYTVQEQSSGFLGLFGKTVTISAKKKAEDDLDELYAAVVEGRQEKKAPEKAPVKKEAVKETPRDQKKEPEKEKKNNRKEFKTEFKTESKYEVKSMKGKDSSSPAPEKKEVKPQKEGAKESPKENPKEKEPPKNTYKENNSRPYGKSSYKDSRNYNRESIEEERERERIAAEKREEKERERKENRKPSDIPACENAAKTFLTQVFSAMNMDVQIETVYDDQEVELTINLSGSDMGILIGKRGQTLDSLQYLVSLVVNKETDGYLRVKLDTENYRARRKETLETLAKNIAYKVRRTRRSVSLEPMNPYERRIIHSTLQNNHYVVTRSEGEDPYRHVVVSLKREGRDQRKGGYSKSNRQDPVDDE